MTDNEILLKILDKVESLEVGQAKLKTEVQEMKSNLLKVRISVDHDIPKQITLVQEQHLDIVAKLDAIADYPETKGRVATLEHVVKAHSQDIQEFKDKAVG